MKSAFKETFDKYELIFTPLLMILVLMTIILFMPQLVVVENFDLIFTLPLVIGMLTGILFAYLLDRFWKQVSAQNIGDFLKMPTLILILLSALATLIASYNITVYFVVIGFGLGNMFTFISIASLTVYYRTYLRKKN